MTVEKIREWFINKFLISPEFGLNYVDWHTENNNECGVTIMFGKRKFDIIFREKSVEKLVKTK